MFSFAYCSIKFLDILSTSDLQDLQTEANKFHQLEKGGSDSRRRFRMRASDDKETAKLLKSTEKSSIFSISKFVGS